MSRTLVIVILLIALALQACGGGADSGGTASSGNKSASGGNMDACNVTIDPLLGLKALAHQFHALKAQCGLTDAQIEEKIGDL